MERSGSKDDGYSTMSSDIHPEILDRFADDTPSSTFVRGTTSSDAVDVFHDDDVTTDDSSNGEGTLVLVRSGNVQKDGSLTSRSGKTGVIGETIEFKTRSSQDCSCGDRTTKIIPSVLQSSLPRREVRKSSVDQANDIIGNKAKISLETASQIRNLPIGGDKSLDVTSDVDSALETSAHSTDTTITLADTVSGSLCSSQVSSSAVEPQLCGGSGIGSSNSHKQGKVGVSKLTKIFDTKGKPAATSTPNSKVNMKSSASLRGDRKPVVKSPVPASPKKTPPARVNESGQANAMSSQASCKQHDSPKRLANQFLKKAATGVSKTCKKITSPSSTAAASSRLPTKQQCLTQKATEMCPDSSKAEAKTIHASKKPVKNSSPNASSGNRLRFGFNTSSKADIEKEKSGQVKKGTTSPPVGAPQQQIKKNNATSAATAKRGLKFLSSSDEKTTKGMEVTKASGVEKDSKTVKGGNKTVPNVRAPKTVRPLSADYASSISNINEVPQPNGDPAISKIKTHEKQRPFSICSDREVCKNGPLRIIMTNQAFQQHSSSDSDSDTEGKLATFSFVKPNNPANRVNPCGSVVNKNVSESDCKTKDQSVLLSNVSVADSISEDGSNEISSQVTTKAESCSPNTSNTSSICTSASILPPAVSSMQACAELHATASSSTTSSTESWQHLQQHQSSNAPSALPYDAQSSHGSTFSSTSSSSSEDHPGEIFDASIPRPGLLRKSKSEYCLSMKPASTSAFDDFFGSAWDSGKVLERSASVSELDLLSKRSGSLYDLDDLNQSFDGWDRPSSSEVR